MDDEMLATSSSAVLKEDWEADDSKVVNGKCIAREKIILGCARSPTCKKKIKISKSGGSPRAGSGVRKIGGGRVSQKRKFLKSRI